MIGLGSAWLTYSIYWGNPFATHLQTAGDEDAGGPLFVYGAPPRLDGAEQYELAEYDEERDGREEDLERQPLANEGR